MRMVDLIPSNTPCLICILDRRSITRITGMAASANEKGPFSGNKDTGRDKRVNSTSKGAGLA